MTIRFVQAWNGYRPDQIVTNPNGGNSEATLISLGYAVADLNGPDNSPVPVTGVVNEVTGGIEVSAAGATLNIAAPVTTPVGFRGTAIATELDIRRLPGGLVTNFDITSKIPAITKTYYVDPINGVNANAGTSAGLAKKDLAVVIALVDVDQIIITGLTADYVGLGVQSWNNVQSTRSFSLINNTGYRYISAACASLPTWAVNGTYSNVYSTVIGATSAAGVTDVSSSSWLTSVNTKGQAVTLSNVPKKYRTLTKVASLAAVTATAGTWFHDGTSLHVRSHDDRNLVGDTKMLPTANSPAQNGRFPSVNSTTIYVQGIDFVGAQNAFYMGMLSTVTGCTFAHNNCSFQGANTGSGLAVLSFSSVYGYRSAAYENYADGFNYHSNESDGTTPATSPNWCEIECVAYGNGTTGSVGTSDNASTSHDFCNGIRLNCTYVNSNDRIMVDSNSAHTWNLGSVVGQPINSGTGYESICALATSKIWLDSSNALSGVSPRWIAAQTAVLKHYNSGTVVNGVTGEATGTVAAYYG